MSNDDLLVRGTELDAADLRVESDHSNSLATGLFYLGVAAWLAGPLRVLTSLPSDLSTATAAAFEPAVPLMGIGFGLVCVGGLLAVVTSATVVRGLESLRGLFDDEPDPEPLGDGGREPVPERERTTDSDPGREDPLAAMGGDDDE